MTIVVAGCGSASPSYPSLGSSGTPASPAVVGKTPGWIPIAGTTYGAGATVAQVTAEAVNPLEVRLHVSATPDVVTKTSYQVHCDSASRLGREVNGSTPVTREIAIPRGPAAGSPGDVQCSITATATKPAQATMTIMLLVRVAP